MADDLTIGRSRSKSSSYLSYKSPQPQSLTAALEMIALSSSQSSASTEKHRATSSDNGHGERSFTDQPRLRVSTDPVMNGSATAPASPMLPKGKKKDKASMLPSPRRPMPSLPHVSGRSVSGPTPVSLHGKVISSPIYDAGNAASYASSALRLSIVPARTHYTFRVIRGNIESESDGESGRSETNPSRYI